MVRLRGGLEDHMHPKFWHWQKGAGALASAPCQDFFGGFVHNALRALQSDQKVIISPQKCALIAQNRSFYHISLTFSLAKMNSALLPKNVVSRICALLLAKFANARILGANPPLTININSHLRCCSLLHSSCHRDSHLDSSRFLSRSPVSSAAPPSPS